MLPALSVVQRGCTAPNGSMQLYVTSTRRPQLLAALQLSRVPYKVRRAPVKSTLVDIRRPRK
jgi:hypothetical protein